MVRSHTALEKRLQSIVNQQSVLYVLQIQNDNSRKSLDRQYGVPLKHNTNPHIAKEGFQTHDWEVSSYSRDLSPLSISFNTWSFVIH